MADFRKLFYALAMVALVVGLSIPASAQGGAVTCNAQTTPTLVRAEGYAELVGDYTLFCSGGTPTAPGQVVPNVNITVFLSTNITSKLTTSNGVFDEALLIIDEPNSPVNPNRPLRNCGAQDEDIGPSGPGVCQIFAPPALPATPGLSNPALTYDGTTTCTGNVTTPTPSAFGCSRPNIFQGRLGTAQNTGQNSSVVFAGVPFDPPGTLTTRTLRITNIRADAEFLGVTSTFTQQAILMSVSFTNTSFVQINNLSGQLLTVATVLHGLSIASDGKGDVAVPNLGFLQCNNENLSLFQGKSNTGSNNPQPQVTFVEGFQNAWKTRNVSFVSRNTQASFDGNGTLVGGATWAGTIQYPGDLAQNVPGAVYNTESGFEYNSTTPIPPVNPPNAQGTQPIPTTTNGSVPMVSVATGIASSGAATQGTRLALNFTNQPQGLNIYVPPVVLLINSLTKGVTGVMVLTSTAADGSGGFTAPTGATGAGAASSGCATGATLPAGCTASFVGTNGLVQVANNLAVWEVLFTDPSSNETATVPVVVAYQSNLSANPPIGLPVPNQIEQVAASFAPFYSSAAARQPSLTLPVPRFIPSNQPLNIIEVVKCACDILFPFVTSASQFDTGIAIANTSQDPGAAFGFGATPQQGTVTFFYFGTGAAGAAPPASQTSAVVPAGQVLTYVLSTGGGAIGTSANGLDNRANGFQGYLIAQSGFQYCHGFAFISPLGGGPTSPGVSEGYLGIILDLAGLNRTAQQAEIRAH